MPSEVKGNITIVLLLLTFVLVVAIVIYLVVHHSKQDKTGEKVNEYMKLFNKMSNDKASRQSITDAVKLDEDNERGVIYKNSAGKDVKYDADDDDNLKPYDDTQEFAACQPCVCDK